MQPAYQILIRSCSIDYFVYTADSLYKFRIFQQFHQLVNCVVWLAEKASCHVLADVIWRKHAMQWYSKYTDSAPWAWDSWPCQQIYKLIGLPASHLSWDGVVIFYRSGVCNAVKNTKQDAKVIIGIGVYWRFRCPSCPTSVSIEQEMIRMMFTWACPVGIQVHQHCLHVNLVPVQDVLSLSQALKALI